MQLSSFMSPYNALFVLNCHPTFASHRTRIVTVNWCWFIYKVIQSIVCHLRWNFYLIIYRQLIHFSGNTNPAWAWHRRKSHMVTFKSFSQCLQVFYYYYYVINHIFQKGGFAFKMYINIVHKQYRYIKKRGAGRVMDRLQEVHEGEFQGRSEST